MINIAVLDDYQDAFKQIIEFGVFFFRKSTYKKANWKTIFLNFLIFMHI